MPCPIFRGRQNWPQNCRNPGTSRKSLVYKGALIHRCRCRARVVAKSALFRFRLAAKTAHAPLLLLSPQKPLRWVSVGAPCLGCCALRARWGATLPKPLVRPAQPDTRFASVRLHGA
ncbi:hypothetical protein DW094_03000 [Ruminococcaceae bacterium AM07-15]|nr:hypothetical protein DW094_03000 [Ruminococcaceae bacterium AM07-15]